MLTLDAEMTHAALQERLVAELGIPAHRQRIKYGFPPRDLQPPPEGQEGDLVPLQHGDRLTIQILPEPKQGM